MQLAPAGTGLIVQRAKAGASRYLIRRHLARDAAYIMMKLVPLERHRRLTTPSGEGIGRLQRPSL